MLYNTVPLVLSHLYITIVMLLPTGAHLKKWKKWLVQDLKVSQNWPECYTSNTVSSTSREGKANIKMAVVARSLSAWMGKRDKSDNAFTAPESLIKRQTCCKKNCLCQYTYRSINCSRVSSSPIPWSLHSLSWISSVVVSPSVLVNHGMLGWVQQGASTPTHCCPSHRGSLGKNVCEWPAAL